ncbi:hypothetical protein DFJ73DRAFT_598594, partial [Zopfochytrium polystomum]
SSSSSSTQRLISAFHVLNKRLALCERAGDARGAERARAAIAAMGGLDAYQRASLRGGDERKGKGACGRWLDDGDDDDRDAVPRRRPAPPPGRRRRLRLLDVGALNGATYAKQSGWIDATYIDLNPQRAGVERQDFFERPLPRGDAERFDVVCLSLVVNFVGEPARRGLMLARARDFLRRGGWLFLVLPLPCVANSRYLTRGRLVEMMAALGLAPVDEKMTRRLAMFVFAHVVGGRAGAEAPLFPKREVNPGGGRNNFCIVL